MGTGTYVSSDELKEHYRENDYFGGSSYWSDSGAKDVTPKKRINDASEIFKERRMKDTFNPAKIRLPREARDSANNPNSRTIILGNDVTASMNKFLLALIQKYYPELIVKIGEAVSFNPHIMFMGIGDVRAGDEAPLQVTQFETDLKILEQLTQIWLEQGGGGNNSESYILAWYFAAKYCEMDCLIKRGEKGFLFTLGDDGPTPSLKSTELRTVFGDRDDLDQRDVTATDCLDMASEKFNCYHIILRGYNYNWSVVRRWRELMGGHVCDLSDYACMPELISTILKMYEGKSKTEVISEIKDSHTRKVVEDALEYHEEYVSDEEVEADNQESMEIF